MFLTIGKPLRIAGIWAVYTFKLTYGRMQSLPDILTDLAFLTAY